MALIPLNCTDRLQPLDLSVNRTFKDFYITSSENGMQSKCAHKLNTIYPEFFTVLNFMDFTVGRAAVKIYSVKILPPHII